MDVLGMLPAWSDRGRRGSVTWRSDYGILAKNELEWVDRVCDGQGANVDGGGEAIMDILLAADKDFGELVFRQKR